MSRNESDNDHRLQRLRNYVLLLVLLAIIPIAAGWVGDVAKDLITGASPYPHQRALLVGGLALLLSAALWLVVKGRSLLPARVLVQSPSFEPRRVVIALLSPSDGDLQRGADGNWEVRSRKSDPWVSLKDKTPEQLAGKNSGVPNWRWQQTLRAAYFHRTAMERLVLVGSTGAKGSGTKLELDLARDFLGSVFKDKVLVYGAPAASEGDYDTRWQADFEDLDGLSRLLRSILRELHRDSAGFADRDIVIDCTGGFKVASIAAALVTLDRPELMFQYVGTGEHAGDVIGFDVATEHYGG